VNAFFCNLLRLARSTADSPIMAVALSWVLLTIACCSALVSGWILLPLCVGGTDSENDPDFDMRMKAVPFALVAFLMYAGAAWLNPSIPGAFAWKILFTLVR
jgi:hypothetical protein